MTVQKLSRREALRGTGVAALAAGAAMVPLVGALAKRSEGGELAELIENHRRALQKYHHMCDVWGVMKTGSAAYKRTEPKWQRANDAERAAALALCSYHCQSLEEASIRARYLDAVPDLFDGVTYHDAMEALNSSFLPPQAA